MTVDLSTHVRPHCKFQEGWITVILLCSQWNASVEMNHMINQSVDAVRRCKECWTHRSAVRLHQRRDGVLCSVSVQPWVSHRRVVACGVKCVVNLSTWRTKRKGTGLALIVYYQRLSLFFWLHLPIIRFSTRTLSWRVFFYESCSLYHFHSPAPFYWWLSLLLCLFLVGTLFCL